MPPEATDPLSRAASPPSRRPASLLALGSAAVLAVYTAGFVRTEEAALAAAARSVPRRRPAPAPETERETAPAAAAAAATASGGSTIPTDPASAPRAAAGVASISVAPPIVRAVTPPSATPESTVPAAAASPAPAGAPPPAVVAAVPSAPPPPPVVVPPDSQGATPPADTAATGAVAKAVAAPAGWRDGTWSGWGTSRHGDIEATVLIEKGRITAAAISQCLTRYSCSWIAHLQGQVVARQSADVDNVSGATESANAFYYAVADALKKAK